METYPFLLTFTFEIAPSISVCHTILSPEIRYNFCPASSATTKKRLLEAKIGLLIFTSLSHSLLPEALYVFSVFFPKVTIYLSYA